MFEIIQNLIDYTGSYTSNFDGYIMYACLALVLLCGVLMIDFACKLLLRFLPKDVK